MKRTFVHLILAVMALPMGLSALAQRTNVRMEIAVNKEDVPAAVLTAFKSAYPKAKVRAYFKEEENGKLSYEIESRDGNIRRVTLYNTDGSVVKIEERIAVNDLPAEARQTIHQKYPKAVVTIVDKVTQGDQVAFAVLVNHDKKRTRLEFDRNGKLTTAYEIKIEAVVGKKIE